MPTRARLDAFIATVVSGDHLRAIEEFYHDDATMQENLADPRQGRTALVAHEAAALARLQRMHTHPPTFVALDGDHVIIAWTFDAIAKDGTAKRLEEVAVQLWRGDRIQTERFVYDTATAWRPVPAPA